MQEPLTFELFAPHLESPFQVADGAGNAATFELVEAADHGSTPRHVAFSLVFRGPPDRFAPQGTYRFAHEGIGALDLFIVPVGRDDRGLYYEACFNRVVAEVAL